jgi:elongation factor 2 kinase
MRATHRAWIHQPSGLVQHTDLSWMCTSKYGLVLKRYYIELEDPKTLKNLYLEDLAMQYMARKYADKFNAKNPPKPVRFVDAAVVDINGLLFWLEPRMEGVYRKYSNNNGWTDESRLTPHAFSHFSYEAGAKDLVIVDMQGVGDDFTDPQIHTDLAFWKKVLFFVKSDARRKVAFL